MGARRWVAGAGDGIAAMIATGPAIAGNVSLLRPELGAARGGPGLHTGAMGVSVRVLVANKVLIWDNSRADAGDTAAGVSFIESKELLLGAITIAVMGANWA